MSLEDDIQFEKEQLISLWKERDQYPENSSAWSHAEDRCVAQLRRLDRLYEQDGREPLSKDDLESLYFSSRF